MPDRPDSIAALGLKDPSATLTVPSTVPSPHQTPPTSAYWIQEQGREAVERVRLEKCGS